MKFTVQQKDLLSTLSIASKGINQNVIIPILENYLFDISPENLSVSGSNQEVYICKTISCKSEGSLKIAIPKEILEQVKLLEDQPLSFEITNLQITIKSASGVYKLSGEIGEDFPVIKNKYESSLSVDAEEFQSALSKTAFCVIINQVSQPFDGLSLSVTPENLTLTGFGNNTLSTQSLPGIGNAELLLTKRVVDVLQAVEFSDTLDIKFDKNAIDFIIDNTLFIRAVLLDMKFPDFKANVNLDQDKTLIIDADILRRGCELVRVMANKQSFLIGLFLSKKELLIKATDTNLGREAKETITGQYSGDDFIIGVNGNFLITALSKLKGEIYLYFSDKNKPIIIRETPGNTDLTNLIIVMPIDIEF